MIDEPERQLTLKDGDSSLTLSKARSRLIARGRREAAALPDPSFFEEYLDHPEAIMILKAIELKEQRNYAELVKWLRKCASAGGGYGVGTEFGSAEYILGECYFYGLGVEQDYAESTRWLLQGLLLTDANQWDEICYLLSRMYALDEALEQWRFPVEGEDGWKEYAEAAKWNREDIEAGQLHRQFCIGLAHAYGLGVTPDEAEAVRWWRKAADGGDVWAQFHLAMAYDKGRGVPQDFVQGYIWINLASSRVTRIDSPYLWFDSSVGDTQKYVADAREELSRKMTPEQIAEAKRLVREWNPNKNNAAL